ncbi:MAG TPA: hypothetical protein VGF76_12470 [Polyangiaceae bacterium]|jgi:hypothetical protein
MTEQDPPQRATQKSGADQTLLGVAPPRVDSSADSPQRSPVFVRSGTSVADVDPPPLPRMALPSRPPHAASASSEVPVAKPNGAVGIRARVESALDYARARPVLSMAVIPVLFSLSLVALTGHRTPQRVVTTNNVAVATPPLPSVSAAVAPPQADTLAELERRPPASLSSRELLLLAEGREGEPARHRAHAEQKRAAASALRDKLAHDPALGKDSALQNQLLHLADDASTAADALSAMALLEPPSGADLLYEVWTGTLVRTDATELARALLYSPDMRPKASPALGVSLDLRVAETCEQYQAILPKALTDGDRRALHLLTKLNVKRGCGPKKTEDCFVCLRDKSDELMATINAVKSRRPPSFTNQ